MKKIILLIMVFLLVSLIFIFTEDKKIFYFTFSTEEKLGVSLEKLKKKYQKKELYEKDVKYIKNNYRTTDLLDDINSNVKIKNTSIKNILIKADVIILMIGKNDYINYINDYELLSDSLINLKADMENLFKSIRDISKEKIIFIGISNDNPENEGIDKVLRNLNEMYSKLSNEYNIYYLDIYDDINSLNINDNITDDYYDYIVDKLIKEMDNDIIN